LQTDPIAPAADPSALTADEAEGGPVILGRITERTATDAPAEAVVPAPDAQQTAEPQTAEPQTAEPQTAEPQTAEPGPIELEVSEQDTDATVATETRPDSAEAVVADLTEMTQPPIASEAAEVEATDATDATAVADEQPTEAATHSATEAPAAAGSPRAKRSAR
jgi:translation initiation factor IF-2